MVAGGGPLDHLKGSRACGRLLVTHALDATGLRRSSLTPAMFCCCFLLLGVDICASGWPWDLWRPLFEPDSSFFVEMVMVKLI